MHSFTLGSPRLLIQGACIQTPFIVLLTENNNDGINIDQPCMVLNANAFLRAVLFGEDVINPYIYCHRPIIVSDSKTLLGTVLFRLRVYPTSEVDDVVDDDLILIWTEEKRVITGADILGRLLRGIVLRDPRQA